MALLEVNNLKKSYIAPDGSREMVIDIELFSLEEGEHIAIEGGSGTGKTTFLHLVAGILQADSGRIEIDGELMSELAESERDLLRANKIGYIFQTFNLLPGFTALENIALGMAFGVGLDMKRAEDLLERVGLGHRGSYLPRQLSVGQQQRVAVARALANRPKIVLADEPTGNLDRENSKDALRLIREVCNEYGSSLLLVSHDPEVLSTFDHIQKFEELNK